jgi:LysM repeat protein
MNKKRLLLLLATVLLIIGLTACERPASQAPQSAASPTVPEGGFPLPGVTDDVMGQLESFATQTAIALTGGTPPAAPLPATTAAETTPEAPAEGAPTAETPAAAAPTTAPQAVAPTQAPAQAPVVYPTATPGKPSSWTLKSGEHPYCIARRFDVNPSDLLDASGLSGGGNYSAGTTLTIPRGGREFPGRRALKDHPDTYTVGARDTIFSIACDYGDADPYAIAAANGISAPYKLSNGQQLYIP